MVNRADINSVLMQMRQVRQQVQPTESTAPIANTSGVNPLSSSSVNPTQNSFAAQLQQQREQLAPSSLHSNINANANVNSFGAAAQSIQREMTQQDFINQASALNTRPQSQMDLTSSSATPSIGEMMGNAIDHVNATQMHAGDLSTRYTQGDPNIDLPEVMVAMQKSSVSFQAMSQVRNKLLEAYKDIMNMPV